jgi:hypothetical protein
MCRRRRRSAVPAEAGCGRGGPHAIDEIRSRASRSPAATRSGALGSLGYGRVLARAWVRACLGVQPVQRLKARLNVL